MRSFLRTFGSDSRTIHTRGRLPFVNNLYGKTQNDTGRVEEFHNARNASGASHGFRQKYVLGVVQISRE